MKTENMQGNLWSFVFSFPFGYKNHYCPKKLVPGLLADLTARIGHDVEIEVEDRDDGMIDLPGMLWVDRPYEKIKIDTFTLEIPSQDFSVFVRKLVEAPRRRFLDGQEYYKIHGYMCCVMFTPEQRDLVLQEMERLIPEAEKRCEEADRAFSDNIAEINKDGVKVISQKDKYSKYAPKFIKAPPKDNN